MKNKTTAFYLFVIVFLLGSCLVAAEQNKIYVLDLKYQEGVITLDNILVKEGFAPDRKTQPESGYLCEVFSFEDEILYSFKFNPPLVISAPPPLEEGDYTGSVVLEETEFTLLVPYFANGETIKIYSPDEIELISTDVSDYALCNFNGRCETGENNQNCPQDCPLYIEREETEEATPLMETIVLTAILAIIIMILIAFNRFKER